MSGRDLLLKLCITMGTDEPALIRTEFKEIRDSIRLCDDYCDDEQI